MPRRRKTPLGRILLITVILILILIISLYYYHRQSNAPQRLEKTNNIARNKPENIRPHFTFYKIISHNDKQQAIPIKNSLPQPILSLAQPANYLLQVVAVKNSAYADQLKAQLILKGYNVSIQKIQANNEELNRVMIGPFATLSKAEEIQTNLKNEKLDSILIKM